ncbi:MAG: GAF domain-containing sensor histidine kinase [Chloroflexi bacterium]|nr:GAF domain-containing sensor histidine kinase [Chloroflexota bacterium]
MLQTIIETATELCNSEAASILLLDKNTQQLKFAASTDSEAAELANIPVPMDHSIAGTIFRENRALIINEVSQDPRHYREVGQKINFEIRTLVGVPMRIKDRGTGVLEAVNKRRGGFSEEDKDTLAILASQAAVAIHNASLLDALQKAYAELGKVDKVKSDFIAVASHELRTPLGVILGYAALLKEKAHGDTVQMVDAVMAAALRMRSVVEDMTNMNLLQVGSTELLKERVPVWQLIQAAGREIEEIAEVKEHSISLEPPVETLWVYADPPKLVLAIGNLLNNAVRFTPPGGKITVRATRHESEVWIQVKDNGIGLAASEIEPIFDEFYQVASHMTRRHGGIGMGLPIVRGLVKVHQGRVWAESKGENQGATFTIALPLVN